MGGAVIEVVTTYTLPDRHIEPMYCFEQLVSADPAHPNSFVPGVRHAADSRTSSAIDTPRLAAQD
jgi:hypothetical protein